MDSEACRVFLDTLTANPALSAGLFIIIGVSIYYGFKKKWFKL